MRTALLAACVISASLLAQNHAVAGGRAAPATVSLDWISGGGTLEGGTTFGVSALSYVVGTHIGNSGSLVLDGVPTDCTIASVATDCSQATLVCEDVSYEMIASVPGQSPGSLGGVPVTQGKIRMFCKNP